MAGDTPSIKEVFDALTGDSSADGCDPDWCGSILDRADPADVKRVQDVLRKGGTESEMAGRLGVLP